MKKNKFFRLLAALHFSSCPPVGGQAVLEGVMMRNGDIYALAVRRPNGKICAERHRWKSFLVRRWLRLPFVRGFPILLETIYNGIKALNRSAAIYEDNSGKNEKTGFLHAFLSLALALFVALLLFVVAPHLLSLLMLAIHAGGDVEGISFHLWDGLYKCAIFGSYLWLISFIPDIHRVFQYHGAEHKTIHAWETGAPLTARLAFSMSRLHPRCGTTFLLFVISVSIVLQAALLPLALEIWSPATMFGKHCYSLCIKLLLVIPISSAAYELIRFAASLPSGLLSTFLQWPGLALQRLTTREPAPDQLEVAIYALAAATREDTDYINPAENIPLQNCD